jgi:putative transcriptional regulator
MTIKELRAQSGLSQSKFAAKFSIPVRTIQAWEQEQSSPPPYLLSMIKSILDSEPQPSKTNPYYDSTFLVSRSDDEKSEQRYLVELYEDELLALRDEINFILKKRGR